MIQTRYDRKRGCGWRKEGGLYLVSDGLSAPCGALPIPIHRCPTCGNGIKAARGFTWIDAGALLAPAVVLCPGRQSILGGLSKEGCARCPMQTITGRQGLIWVGGAFYRTPEDFTREAASQGVSRRISQLPKDFKVGETWVFVAHREAIPATAAGRELDRLEGKKPVEGTPGVFHAFKPSAVEYVVKGDESPEKLERLAKRGVTPVKVVRVQEQGELEASNV